MKHIAFFLASFMLVILSGCGAMYYYQNPESADAATLTIRNNSDYMIGVLGYDVGADCSGPLVHFQKVIGDQSGVGSLEEKVIRVNGNEEFSFKARAIVLFAVVYERYCEVLVTFTPRFNATYVATYDYDNTQDKCSITMERLEDGKWVEDDTIRNRIPTMPVGAKGPKCK